MCPEGIEPLRSATSLGLGSNGFTVRREERDTRNHDLSNILQMLIHGAPTEWDGSASNRRPPRFQHGALPV